MLKINLLRERKGTTVVLAGRLVGPWVQEARRCWMEAGAACGEPCRVDLRETTHVDEAGKTLLAEMFRQGVTFEVKGCLMRAIVESLGAAPGPSSHGRPAPQPVGESRGS
jgi:ABC-type transporter Mla MlaB component